MRSDSRAVTLSQNIAAVLAVAGVIAVATNAQAQATGRYAEVNGIKLYYEIHGTGRPLILQP
jgi:hypothetical protein